MLRAPQEKNVVYLRNFVFGAEDSLVSTVGLLSGIAIAQVPGNTIFLTGAVLITVEAFSMAVGSFLSEDSAEDYMAQREVPLKTPIVGGVVMFVSYLIAGIIPLFPYKIFPTQQAFVFSILLALAALFVLGLISGRFARVGAVKHGVRMLLVGGIAIGIGMLVGGFLHIGI